MMKLYTEVTNFQTHRLTLWGPVAHICVSKLTIISSDNALSPGRRQAIIWTNAGILLIRNLGTNFNEMLSKIVTFSFSFESVVCDMASILSRPQWVKPLYTCQNTLTLVLFVQNIAHKMAGNVVMKLTFTSPDINGAIRSMFQISKGWF